MPIRVVPFSPGWARDFARVAEVLADALAGVPILSIEHVGSTSVVGLAAKPILDVDVIVRRDGVPAAIAALEELGYVHRGDLGVPDREAFLAPDRDPERHVYVCVDGALAVRNHLAVRDALRARRDLRDRYAAVKFALAGQPDMTIERYVEGKSRVLQEVLAVSDLTDSEKQSILEINAAP